MPPGRRPANQNPSPSPRREPQPFATNPMFEGERREQQWGAQNAGSQMMGSPSQDTYNEQSWTELLDGMFGMFGPGSGGSGSRGGGGGGGAVRPSDPDPMSWNAIAQVQNMERGYGAMLEALRAQQNAQLGALDTRRIGMETANAASQQRLNQILNDLNANAAATRTNVQGSFAQGDQALANLMNQYTGMVAQRQPGVANTIQAFGGNPAEAFGDQSSIQDMITAQRANLARVGQADDAFYANRGNVYGGLSSDVSTRNQQVFDQLMAQLLAERQQTESQNAAAQAQLAMQQQQAILQAQAAEQARRAGYV